VSFLTVILSLQSALQMPRKETSGNASINVKACTLIPVYIVGPMLVVGVENAYGMKVPTNIGV